MFYLRLSHWVNSVCWRSDQCVFRLHHLWASVISNAESSSAPSRGRGSSREPSKCEAGILSHSRKSLFETAPTDNYQMSPLHKNQSKFTAPWGELWAWSPSISAHPTQSGSIQPAQADVPINKTWSSYLSCVACSWFCSFQIHLPSTRMDKLPECSNDWLHWSKMK